MPPWVSENSDLSTFHFFWYVCCSQLLEVWMEKEEEVGVQRRASAARFLCDRIPGLMGKVVNNAITSSI